MSLYITAAAELAVRLLRAGRTSSIVLGTSDLLAQSIETTGFRALGGDRYEARGRLRIKATSLRVVLPFTFRETGGVATVEGRLQLDRTALNLGLETDATGDWVSKMIDVQIKVRAHRTE